MAPNVRAPLDTLSENMSRQQQSVLLPGTKGLPPGAFGSTFSEIGGLGLSLLDGKLPFPVAVLRESELSHNLESMMAYTRGLGVHLCPHGKTTMCPQLFHRQIASGCWGITVATAVQARTCADSGIGRILIANQVVDPCSIDIVRGILADYPGTEILLIVDSEDGCALLEQQPADTPWQVLIELGFAGGRTGVRTIEEGLALGRHVRNSRALSLRGLECFEGVVSGPDDASIEARIETLLYDLYVLLQAGRSEHWFGPGPVFLTAGGSAYFDIVAHQLTKCAVATGSELILRSGCYITHDVSYYARHANRRDTVRHGGPSFRNALEVWSVVQSAPEPGRAVCAAGKRDLSYDMDLPVLLKWFRRGLHTVPQRVPDGILVTGLNDQHAYISKSDGPLPFRVGDLICLGISHPCTTFDKWKLIYGVNDAYEVTQAYQTYF
jgi:D-serine dehydratase